MISEVPFLNNNGPLQYFRRARWFLLIYFAWTPHYFPAANRPNLDFLWSPALRMTQAGKLNRVCEISERADRKHFVTFPERSHQVLSIIFEPFKRNSKQLIEPSNMILPVIQLRIQNNELKPFWRRSYSILEEGLRWQILHSFPHFALKYEFTEYRTSFQLSLGSNPKHSQDFLWKRNKEPENCM